MNTTGIESLNFLIGIWNTKGEVIESPGRKTERISGTDTYEWVLNNRFILHRANVMMGDVQTEVIELIGYDADAQNYTLQSFDNTGTITTMHGVMKSNGLLEIKDKTMRSTLHAAKDGNSMKAVWERADDDNNWVTWMNLSFNKVKFD
jgi:hypothetical protein